MGTQARLWAEEAGVFAGNAFPGSSSAVLTPRLGGVLVALSPSLSRPRHPPSLSLNHSDPAHLEPMCFRILSSTAVISNQPICVSLSPHQRPAPPHLSPVREAQASVCLEKRQKCCFVHPELSELCLFYIHHLHSMGSHAFSPDRRLKHWVNKRSASKGVN